MPHPGLRVQLLRRHVRRRRNPEDGVRLSGWSRLTLAVRGRNGPRARGHRKLVELLERSVLLTDSKHAHADAKFELAFAKRSGCRDECRRLAPLVFTPCGKS